MSILYGTKINQLLANTAPTGLLFADWIKKKAIGPTAKKIRDSPDFVIVSPKNLHQRVLLFSDALPSALFGCKPPCSEVA